MYLILSLSHENEIKIKSVLKADHTTPVSNNLPL